MVINVAKSVFGASSLHYLGHVVDPTGIRPLEGKVQAIQDFPQPTTTSKLREFLGLITVIIVLFHTAPLYLSPLTFLLRNHGRSSDTLEWQTLLQLH